MSTVRIWAASSAALLLATATGAVAAGSGNTLYVHCGANDGFNSIGAALKALKNADDSGSSTINVSDVCHENVLIQNMDRLTIVGVNGASITDASAGALDVVDIRNSSVTITGLTINGLNGVNNDTVDCEQVSRCTLIGNTLNGDADVVGVYTLSSALIVGGVIQNGTSDGIYTAGDVAAFGVQIQGNPVGAFVRPGGRLRISAADPASFPEFHSATPATVVHNSEGIDVSGGAEFSCTGCIVENNSGDGIHADVSAAVTIAPQALPEGSKISPSVTLNTGHGVYLGDLASGTFNGPGVTVTGNAQPDILCNSPTSVSRRALVAAGGAAHTNCTN
jgi:hypothetical protein